MKNELRKKWCEWRRQALGMQGQHFRWRNPSVYSNFSSAFQPLLKSTGNTHRRVLLLELAERGRGRHEGRSTGLRPLGALLTEWSLGVM